MVALKENLESVRHFTALAHHDAVALRSAAKRLNTVVVTRYPDLTQRGAVRALVRSLRRFGKTSKALGARGYPDDLADRLERMWGLRTHAPLGEDE